MLTALFKDLGLGERIKIKELHQLVCDDPAYQNLTMEEEDEMKQDVREISDILTHIESEPATIETSDGLVRVPNFEKRLQAVTRALAWSVWRRTVRASMRSRCTSKPRPTEVGTTISPLALTVTAGSMMSCAQ